MSTVPAVKAITKVQSDIFPYDYNQDLYQRYYQAGLSMYLAERGIRVGFDLTAHFPGLLRAMGHVRESRKIDIVFGPMADALKKAVDRLAWTFGVRKRALSSTVGLYTFDLSGKQVHVCIDSADFGAIKNPAILDLCDLYFKTNYNIEYKYEEKVLPFYNCNPMILDRIKTLRALRHLKPEYDICFIVRVWGGGNEIEGIEHCMQLLEWIARTRARKYILAYLVAGEKDKLAQRLAKLGIQSTRKPIPIQLLWEISARSKINIIRLGMHQCIPWRMSDLMALGVCPVFDQNIKTIWPDPLIERRHYYSLNASTFANQPVADSNTYRGIPDVLEYLLADEGRLKEIGRCNEAYFDHNLAPKEIGRQICDVVMSSE